MNLKEAVLKGNCMELITPLFVSRVSDM
ncbi:hypothetical protein Goarm_006022 [Gossypium armourianum]|uniref:Uncharacterized protein n=1 Tax=Gossypium armourianum TaxID=34283 RepID=A0A7J9JGR4_9ROSI|nr:hypothetical protein [Gossypium armourianum]